MEKGFREQLMHEFVEPARRQVAGETALGNELPDMEKLLSEPEQTGAGRTMSSALRKTVYELQAEKQKIFARLKADLRLIDTGKQAARGTEREPVGTRQVHYNDLHGLTWNNAAIDAPDVLTDGEWGIEYKLDATVPRELRKTYAVETAKRKIRELLNRQITAVETRRPDIDPGKRDAYLAREAEPDENRPGLIAEKMVRNLLKKLSLNKEFGFSLKDEDIYGDVNEKIDFIIHRDSVRKGVGVEASQDIAIQFTTDLSEKKKKRKEGQLQKVRMHAEGSRIQDYILVRVPIKDAKEKYVQWTRGRPPGGPDRLWEREKKVEIVREVLAKIFTTQEIEKICQAVS